MTRSKFVAFVGLGCVFGGLSLIGCAVGTEFPLEQTVGAGNQGPAGNLPLQFGSDGGIRMPVTDEPEIDEPELEPKPAEPQDVPSCSTGGGLGGGLPECGPDGDGDGVADADDKCPEDGNKTKPGACGCGETDTDADRDGTLDCDDACPDDARKTEIGSCGCGAPDVEPDSNGVVKCGPDTDKDGTVDSEDGCAMDAAKTEPGDCGCGSPDDDLDMNGVTDCLDTPSPGCSKNVVYMDRRYRFCTNAKGFTAAAADCDAQNMPLARIDSAAENTWVRAEASKAGLGAVWIGASDSVTEGNWTWRDGETFWIGLSNGMPQGGLFESWESDEPTNSWSSGEDCAYMGGGGLWNDTNCGDGYDYVCEQP